MQHKKWTTLLSTMLVSCIKLLTPKAITCFAKIHQGGNHTSGIVATSNPYFDWEAKYAMKQTLRSVDSRSSPISEGRWDIFFVTRLPTKMTKTHNFASPQTVVLQHLNNKLQLNTLSLNRWMASARFSNSLPGSRWINEKCTTTGPLGIYQFIGTWELRFPSFIFKG